MAISGGGDFIPAVRVCIRHRQLRQTYPQHNVHRSKVWMPEQAAARFLDCPDDWIYVAIVDEGGVSYLWELLVEVGLLDPPWTVEQWLQHVRGK